MLLMFPFSLSKISRKAGSTEEGNNIITTYTVTDATDRKFHD